MLNLEGPTTEPEDPVLARLFPTAYPENQEAAAELVRRFEPAEPDRWDGEYRRFQDYMEFTCA